MSWIEGHIHVETQQETDMKKEGWQFCTNIGEGSDQKKRIDEYSNKSDYRILPDAFCRNGKPTDGVAVYRRIKNKSKG